MLVLSRKPGEKILIGDNVSVTIVRIGPNTVRIGIEAPRNMNIVRDPRFRRNCEIPSEDPLLAGSYATEYVKGCQVSSDPRLRKMVAGLKHFAAYSCETDRGEFYANISEHRLTCLTRRVRNSF